MKRTFKIYRYDPDKDAKPYMQTVQVELDGHERMLLDALVKLKAMDPSIAFRRSCREGVCGSDAMNINGKNGLACLTNMNTLKGDIVLKPLPGLPVIRDLIVDMTQFFKQYHSIKPYLQRHAAQQGAPAVARRARRAQRPVRVHSVRQLLHQLPLVLVEPRQVRGPGRSAAGLPLHRGQPRHSHGRAPGQPGRSVPPVPLPHHHELRGRVPQGPEPHQAIGKIKELMVRRAV
jgi:succinate dehydrogenase / fumarate reductase iron-sulfur subunit